MCIVLYFRLIIYLFVIQYIIYNLVFIYNIMKSISYLNTNENVFLFSDPELNIVENWELVEYNENGNDPLVINNISTSFNDQYILYK